jgi:RNA polymerase sigma-70 factor (ECF subfamily)
VPTQANFEQIVCDHQAAVFRTLARLIGRREDIEDLAQEVFLRLYRALPSFRGEAQISTFLYRITVNVAQDEWKRRRRVDRPLVSISDGDAGWKDRLSHPDRNPEQQLSDREFGQAVESELTQLSNVERTVLVLFHQEEQTYEQIALTLAMPINTIRTHLHRGRRRLREAIAPLTSPSAHVPVRRTP